MRKDPMIRFLFVMDLRVTLDGDFCSTSPKRSKLVIEMELIEYIIGMFADY